jgi:poly-gamma-glutamate synthesis protein (capsule biosynthesis protein)
VTIAFAGDVHFEDQLASRLDDPERALAPIAPQLSAADLMVLNLESAIGTGGKPEAKRYTFQAPPTALTALAAAGVDVVSMANNHAADYGGKGIRDALTAARAAAESDPALAVVGIGANEEEAFAPATFEIGGLRIAVIGASAADTDPTADPTGHWAALRDRAGTAEATDPRRLLQAVAAASSTADLVVIYLHWGIQGRDCPSASQRSLAQRLARGGADAVVGAHAHRLQGAGTLGDTYVAYGLGNFIWFSDQPEASAATGVLTLTLDEGGTVEPSWAPARVGPTGLPKFATGRRADRSASEFDALRSCADLG